MENEMKRKVYLCKMNQCLIDTVTRIVKFIEDKGDICLQYLGGKYTDDDLLSADMVLVLLQDSSQYCGKGIHSQIKVALNASKEVYLIRFDENNEIKTFRIKSVREFDTKDFKAKYGIITLEGQEEK